MKPRPKTLKVFLIFPIKLEKSFLKLKKEVYVKVQEVYRTPNRLDQKRKYS